MSIYTDNAVFELERAEKALAGLRERVAKGPSHDDADECFRIVKKVMNAHASITSHIDVEHDLKVIREAKGTAGA